MNIITKIFILDILLKDHPEDNNGAPATLLVEGCCVCVNTLVATGIALVYGGNCIRADSIGTHLIENAIGIARQTSNDPRWDRIVTTFSHAELRKKLANKYKLQLYVHGRINDGGCKIDEIEDASRKKSKLKSKPERWTIINIIQLMQGLCNPDVSCSFHGELDLFIKEIEELLPLMEEHECDVNDTANNGIIARLISFKYEE